jgi:hypothetical protein
LRRLPLEFDARQFRDAVAHLPKKLLTRAPEPTACPSRFEIAIRVGEVFFVVQTWSSWKRFSDAANDGTVEAPIGPGVYEVRHTMTGRVIAFGDSANVAQSLSTLEANGGLSPLARLFRKPPLVPRVADLEYRTCSAGSRAEAKAAAHRLLGLRQTAWRRRVDFGSAARLLG